jgi:hypothetical protein
MAVWSSVRVVLFREPSSLTSANSFAYSLLQSGFGPRERKSHAALIMNGLTSFTQALGSFTNIGSTGRHSPGSSPTVNLNAPNRPSFILANSITRAAFSPTATPPSLALPGGMPANDVMYCDVSPDSCAGTMPTRTRYAAVAAAASFEYHRFALGETRYGW